MGTKALASEFCGRRLDSSAGCSTSRPSTAKSVVKRNKRSGTTRAAATIGTDVQTLKQVDPQLAEKCITAVRMLTVDSVENAQVGMY